MLDNIAMVMRGITPNLFNSFLIKMNTFVIVERNEYLIKIDWLNMRIVYRPQNGNLVIKNSIHKLYNIKYGSGKPDNSTDFTFNQFCLMANHISSIFETELHNITVQGYFEFGVNIETDERHAFNIFQRYMTYRSVQLNPFETIPKKRGKPQYRCCYLTDYRIKAYHKNFLPEIGLKSEKNVMRFEIVSTALRMLRKILGLDVITLKDLTQRNIWERMIAFTLDSYDKIQKIPMVKTDILSNEVDIIHSYCNSLIYSDVKNLWTEAHFKKIRREGKLIYEKWDKAENNSHVLIRQDLKQKMEYLILN
jgi:hypothetical protein